MHRPPFLTPALARAIAREHGTPCYVYSQAALEAQADAMLAFPNAFGLTVRFAMKACPNAAVLQTFHRRGLHIDASSGHEVRRALRAGIPPECICLSSQELPADLEHGDFAELLQRGVKVNACSLLQVERLGRKLGAGHAIGIRFNPGQGSGGHGKTNVGGPDSSFGIWHELADKVKAAAAKFGLKIVRIHTHIGSGSDPDVWLNVANLSLALVAQFPDVTTLNLGGGFKVARVATEKQTDPQVVGQPVKQAFEAFARSHPGRQLHLEVEPGTFLVANAGVVLCRVQDVVSTTAQRNFIKLDSGMTEIVRPSLYGAQHPVYLYPQSEDEEDRVVEKLGEKFEKEVGKEQAATESAATSTTSAASQADMMDYILVGHCCETGDLISCKPGEPEALGPRTLPRAQAGDLCVIGGAGAYCSSMSTKNYNSFPEAPEVMLLLLDESGSGGGFKLIRKRQTLEQMIQNEVPL